MNLNLKNAFCGRRQIDYYAPEARPIIQEAVNNAIATGEDWNLELPFITAKGKTSWIRSLENQMKQGKTAHTRVFQDITDAAAEEALRQSEELLRLSYEYLGPCIRDDPAAINLHLRMSPTSLLLFGRTAGARNISNLIGGDLFSIVDWKRVAKLPISRD